MIKKQYPHLLAPLKVGSTTFRNRIFTAPITLHSLQANEPYPTEAVITHFANKAKGGAACVTCAGVSIFPVTNDDHLNYDVYNQSPIHYLAQLADRIHFYGAKASMELGVGGVVGGIYGVSDGVRLMTGQLGKEMPEEEMERIANGYAHAAKALKNAGFDMVLLHFGHGLLVGQFLSPLTNKRTDKYGGSLENRARFPLMIIDRIREKVGRDLLIEVRISGAEFEPGGIVIEESIDFIKMIQDKIDLIHVSAGMHHPKWMTVTHPCGFLPPMPNVFLAATVKKANLKIPVVTIGGIQDLDGAEKIIEDSKADVVSIARGFIADPNLGEKAYSGHGDDITPCIKCMRCLDSAVHEYHYVCSVNPEIGLEHKLPVLVQPTSAKKKVIVIGGGPAGMKSALIAAQRGHEVTLFEKSDSLGGALKFAKFVSFKYDLNRFKNYLVYQVQKSNIRVKLNTEATPSLLQAENADVIIAALGATPIIPSLPGMDGKNVLLAVDYYGMEDKIGQKVAIIGGGQVGCETALHLAKLSKEVTIIEMQSELAADASGTHRTELLLELDNENNLHYITSARCTSIITKDICYRDKTDIEKRIAVDTVIIAVGMKANDQDAEAFRSLAERFVAIGDCVRPAIVEKAISSAFCATVQI